MSVKSIDKGIHGIPELDAVAKILCSPESHGQVAHKTLHDSPMPSPEALVELMQRLKAVIFPGFYDLTHVEPESVHYHLLANLDSIYRILSIQIKYGYCFTPGNEASSAKDIEKKAQSYALEFIKSLPDIRALLASDVHAAYEGDPAAKSPGETVFCYPSLQAMIHHRIAHELYCLGVPLIPRIISEMSHSLTGIDIHPGARIGENFFIDHGTGVVVGETCIIGNGCRLYQGVTLGALYFPKEEDGTLVKGRDRHPVLEDNVTVYAGATILGRVTIGKNSVIGGNVWLTHDVPEASKIVQQRSTSPDKSEKVLGK